MGDHAMRQVLRLSALCGLLVGVMGPVQGALAATPAAPSAAVPEVIQQPAGDLPAAEAVFERYIEAIGGREKVFAIKNREVTGFYVGEPFEFRANVKMWWEEGGKFHQQVAEPAGLRFDLYANGEYTWINLQDKPPALLAGLQRIELLDTADVHGEANYKERYKELTTAGRAKADGKPVIAVKAVTHSGRPHMHFFDEQSGLLVGTRVPTLGPGGKVREMMLRLAEYKDFGGVLYPTRLEQTFANAETVNAFIYQDVRVNVAEPHDYTVPTSVIEEFKAAVEKAAEEPGADASGG